MTVHAMLDRDVEPAEINQIFDWVGPDDKVVVQVLKHTACKQLRVEVNGIPYLVVNNISNENLRVQGDR